jgi:hypothetical protein
MPGISGALDASFATEVRQLHTAASTSKIVAARLKSSDILIQTSRGYELSK